MTGDERRPRDRGVTLVELVIAVVVSVTVMGVLTAILITSLGVADTTSSIVADSTDESLISGYLVRDAQSAAGTDPTTATIADGVGIAVPSGDAGWGSCAQSGTLVVRFDWLDRSASRSRPVSVTWAVDATGQLVRRTCLEGTTVDVVLGRQIDSAVAACAPDPTCVGRPTSLGLTVRGGAGRVPTEYTLTATLRGEVQTAPTTSDASPVPLLVVGEQSSTGGCPVLRMTGTGVVNVRGDAVVSAACGAAPIEGDQTLLQPTGTTATISGVRDPYVAMSAPSTTCSASSGLAPGQSTGASSLTVHTAAVTLSGAVPFQPGRHVFCAGITVAAGAVVSGTDVLWYVPSGGVRISSGATVDLAPATSGPYANLLLWNADTSSVAITTGETVNNLRGVVYAPRARVTVTTAEAVHVGGIVSAETTFAGAGTARLGLPIPTFAVTPASLPAGQSGVAYPSTSIVASGGTAPVTYTATGLPAGLALSTSGVVSGTPTASGTFTVVLTANDATGARARTTRTLTIRPPVAVAGPATLANGTAGTPYPSVTFIASGGLAPYSWTATGVPAGMSVSSAGVLSGRPTAAGSYGITVTVADAAAGTATRQYTLEIGPPLTASNPFAATQRFQILTEGNATLGSFEIQGAAAVGGDLVFKNYQPIASQETSTFVPTAGGQAVGLVVGGTADLTGSGSGSQLTVTNGFLHLGSLGTGALTTWGTNVHLAPAGVADNWSTPRIVVSANQSNQAVYPVVAPGVFDTTSTFQQLRASSATIGALDPATCSSIAAPTVTSAYGNHTLALVTGKVNVWNLRLADIVAMQNVSGPTVTSPTAPLVINVLDSGVVTLPNRYWSPLQSGSKASILWNFPNATAVNVSSVFYGSLFAPDAVVTIDNVTFDGDVVAKSAVLTSGRFQLAHWTTPIPCTSGALSVAGPASVPDGQVGIASSLTMEAAGGAPDYTWTATGLPPGMTMSSAGVLSGTPTTAGLYTIATTVTDAVGATATRSYTTTVRAVPTVSGPASLAAGEVAQPYPSTTFTATGGLAPYRWSASNLHAGLTMSTAGVLSGTPTANGTRSVTVTVTDAAGATATRSYTLAVNGVVCPTITGWKAEFYNNDTLTGPSVLCRNDTTIAFNWGSGSPDPAVKSDLFSVRWSRTQNFTAGSYRFTMGGDDGIRLYVDGKLVIDAWYVQGYTTYTTWVDLTAGSHTIVMEMYENYGDAAATLEWSSLVPDSCPAADPDKWTMEVYDGTQLTGPLYRCRLESNLDFNWGSGTPDSSVGNDTFSVRWTRSWSFVGGTYQFTAGSDDGVRVYVDGTLVIDFWRDRSYGTSSATLNLVSGKHTVVMEFYENGGAARALLDIRKV